MRSQLEHLIRTQEMMNSGIGFVKIISMTECLYKAFEINGNSYVYNPMRASAISNIENSDTYCFLCSILATLYAVEKSHFERVSNYRQNFTEINSEGLDFANEFKRNDAHIFEKV